LLFVLPAVFVTLVSRIVKLHDLISDVFGIRARFDLYRIMIPLCGDLGIAVDKTFRDKLSGRRKAAMQRTYYAYVSFEDPKISKALVLGAIDRRTWYWILLESSAVLGIGASVLLVFSAYTLVVILLIVLFLAILLFATHYEAC